MLVVFNNFLSFDFDSGMVDAWDDHKFTIKFIFLLFQNLVAHRPARHLNEGSPQSPWFFN